MNKNGIQHFLAIKAKFGGGFANQCYQRLLVSRADNPDSVIHPCSEIPCNQLMLQRANDKRALITQGAFELLLVAYRLQLISKRGK